jgi:hypothetical protein
VATEKGCATHDVSLAAAVRAPFLLLRIEAVIHTMVTWLLLHRIHPSTPLAVSALLLPLLFGHLYDQEMLDVKRKENCKIFFEYKDALEENTMCISSYT